MNPIPVPSKWIGWVLAGLCAMAFGLALTCPTPQPEPSKLTHAHDSTVHAVAVMDSVRTRVQIAHGITALHQQRLAPLRARIVLTPNGVLVDGRDTLSGLGSGVVVQVLAAQDTTIKALEHESATKDTAMHADSLALDASRKETKVAVSMIPSKMSRVLSAVRWLVIGAASGVVLHAVLR